MDAKIKRKYLKKIVASFLMLIVAAGVCITACTAQLFAWFSFQSEQKGNFDVTIRDDIKVEISVSTDGETWYGAQDDITFQNIFCGAANAKTLYVRMKNNDGRNVNATLSFRRPDGTYGEESPYTTGGVYYYLGSQLQISGARATVNGQIVDVSGKDAGLGKYLVTTSSNGLTKGQVTGYGSAVTNIPRLDIIDGFTLLKDSETVFEIDFTFVDNLTDQSVYQNADNFVCRRRLMAEWGEIGT